MHDNWAILSKFQEEYLTIDTGSILDVGSMDMNGSCKHLWEGWKYTGLDILQGPNVDIVVSETEDWNLSQSFDVVISLNTVEHCKDPFHLFKQIGLASKGLVLVTSPFFIKPHILPIGDAQTKELLCTIGDYWRLLPDAMIMLLKDNGIDPINVGVTKDYIDTYAVGKSIKR
jgi:hypothetical protein